MAVQSTVQDSQYKPTPSARQAVGVTRRVLLRHTGLIVELWAVIAGVSGFDD
jgi:hypothetical protein